MDKKLIKVLLSLLLVLLAVISYFPLARAAENAAVSNRLMDSIEEKTATVLKLTSASALASAGISAIPGDTATPIAEKLADLTGYFLIILSVLYTEKTLLTLLGVSAFKVFIPLGCLLGLAGIWVWSRGKMLAWKLLLFTAAVTVAIPMSLLISDRVYENYSDRIEKTLDSSKMLSDKTAPLAEADESLFKSILNKLSETASSLSDKAADLLNRYVESAAILIVTSCILPCLGLVFIVFLIRMVFGFDAVSRVKPFLAKGATDRNRVKP